MFSKAIITSTLLAATSAHQNFHQFWVNDVTPGYQVGIRMPPSNSPVTDVTSDSITCNVNGNKVPSGVDTVAAAEGDSIKVQWDQSGHPGPITHMLFGPVDDAASATGIGSWFKIDELDYVNGEWASAIMAADNMTHIFKLPTGLKSGEYLLRSEMLALHGSQTVGGAQFYIGCAQLKITGTGSGSCTPNIKLPGAYNVNDSDIYIPNFYNGFDAASYTAPGGTVATCGGSSVSVASSSAAATKPTSSAVVPSASSSVTTSASATAVTLPTSAVASNATSSAAPLPSATSAASSVIPISSKSSLPSAALSSSTTIPSTLATSIRPSSSGVPSGVAVPSGTGSAGIVAQRYYQCGGAGWTGTTACVTGASCTKQNLYYWQCM